MNPIIFQGNSAFSDFRLCGLRHKITEKSGLKTPPELRAVQVFFLELEHSNPLSPSVESRIQSLLGARKTKMKAVLNEREGFYVTPRKGAISPWSSKATDIFHNCGLTEIKRVEHGIHYLLVDPQEQPIPLTEIQNILPLLHDRMTEGCYQDTTDLFRHLEPKPSIFVDIMKEGIQALHKANSEMGLALNEEEIKYLYDAFRNRHRNPTDTELVMFAQVNSEHCRHKIFNAEWIIDGQIREATLFDMIRNTHRQHPHGTLVAYKDNSGVLTGWPERFFETRPDRNNIYNSVEARVDMVMKVETHNHPTAISPHPGAATGVGGEIRDEAATGIGGRSKAGLSVFMVSNLKIPDLSMPWEQTRIEPPERLASALRIMLEGPIGGASFGNEFGRPAITGVFRTYEENFANRFRGYHKPIMAAGGMGNIKRGHVHKHPLSLGAKVIQLGGPAMRIGLSGGAASSMATGSNALDLDFNSVQRDNAEMQRRCQSVIDACTARGEENPILSIHDIGAGGLANGCPELIAESGAHFYLRKIQNEESSMNPMEIWCCEAQERYVLAVAPEKLSDFMEMCSRERCPAAEIGETTGDGRLTLYDELFGNNPVDMDVSTLLGKPPKMVRKAERLSPPQSSFDSSAISLKEAIDRVLHLPAVAAKTFLITIADRSVTGLVARDQMTGPYQTPLADVGVTATGYETFHGEAMAIGERPAAALLSGPASGRLAIGEALTNIAAASVGDLSNVKLSGNWMCGCGEPGEDAALYDTVEALGHELCPALGLAIPVGKDSLSMRAVWQDNQGKDHKMTAPLSLIISAFSPVDDVRLTATPDIKPKPESRLILLDLGQGKNRVGGSALAQVFNQLGDSPPDLDDPNLFRNFFMTIQQTLQENLLLAYHDRSDGGLFATLAEMAFGGRQGVRVDLSSLSTAAAENNSEKAIDPTNEEAEKRNILQILFNEELGAIVQVKAENLSRFHEICRDMSIAHLVHDLGAPSDDDSLIILEKEREVYHESIMELNRKWSETTFKLQELRDNPACAREEYNNLLDENDPGMNFHLPYDLEGGNFTITTGASPRIAVLREQGVNGQREMAAAFTAAGFECQDVHMTDLAWNKADLEDFSGIVACGGFSYGDVLGAGAGWAKSILYNDKLKDQFARFFARADTFTLGICNGCQMIARLKEIIPGAGVWPVFKSNRSEQFEARYVTVEILPSPSLFFKGMDGARIPVPVAHGEGRIDLPEDQLPNPEDPASIAVLRYIDNYGRPTERYPFNPNGSIAGLTGLTTTDGKVTIMMPHPERGFRAVQMSWRPPNWNSETGPWMAMFKNARAAFE